MNVTKWVRGDPSKQERTDLNPPPPPNIYINHIKYTRLDEHFLR